MFQKREGIDPGQMLRNVKLEEISDGKLYGANELVKADCHDCVGCCDCCCGMGESILLDPSDVYRLSAGVGLSFEQLLETHLELHVVDGVILPNLKMEGKRDCCTFLNEKGRCSVHPYRPGICRLFPLGRFYEDGSFRYFLQTQECRKEGRSKIKVKKWVDLPEFGRYEHFIQEWHDFVRSLQDQLMAKPDMERAKQVNLYVLNVFFYRPWERERDFYEQFEDRLTAAEEALCGE